MKCDCGHTSKDHEDIPGGLCGVCTKCDCHSFGITYYAPKSEAQ